MKKTLLFIPIIALALSGCQQSHLSKANKEYDQLRYSNAIKLYEKHLEKGEDLRVREKLAQAYLNVKDYKKAELEYMKVVTHSQVDPISIFNYARVLVMNGKYENAQGWLEKYLSQNSNDAKAKYLLTNLQEIGKINPDPGRLKVSDVLIKKTDCAFSCSPYKDGIVYTASVKTGNEKIDPWTGKNFYNLYYSALTGGGDWTDPIPLKGEINGPFHEGTPVFNSDGTELTFTRSNYNTSKKLKKNKENESNLKLFQARAVNGEWKELKELPFNSDDYSTGHPAYFINDMALIFASDRPGGKGGTDLYISYKTATGFTPPINLGSEVNTPGNEMFPWFNKKDSTLYFSSEGHLNLGGLDVFKSKYTGKEWQRPINLGIPINSSKDDFSYVMNADNESGFVSSNRNETDQIYEFKLEELIINLIGKTLEKSGSDVPLTEVFIEVTNKETGVKRRYSSGLEGGFKIKLEPEMDYKIFAAKDDYYASKPIEISTRGINRSQNIVADFELEKIVIDKPIVVNNLYYELAKWNLKPDALPVLDQLVSFLNENPGIYIELSSHTDSRASDQYNMALSEKRAKSAVDYIVSKGISRDRITAKGYGETKLLNKCKNGVKCTEEEHALNRRTEFKVLKVTKGSCDRLPGE